MFMCLVRPQGYKMSPHLSNLFYLLCSSLHHYVSNSVQVCLSLLQLCLLFVGLFGFFIVCTTCCLCVRIL